MSDEHERVIAKIERARRSLEPLVDQAPRSEGGERVLGETLTDLSAALEELRIAAEVIQEQHEELAAARVEQDSANAAIDEERRRYQELFDLAPDGYLVTDAAGVIARANRAASRLLGVEARFLAGKPLDLYVTVGSRPALRARLASVQRGEPSPAWEIVVQPRGGEPFPAHVAVAAGRDAAGRPAELLWLVRDITELTRAQTALRESEAGYRDLFENANDLIFSLDPEGRLTSLNRAGERALGYGRKEIVGTPLEDLVVPPDREVVRAALAGQVAGGHEAATFEVEARSGDGRLLPLEVTTRLICRAGRAAGVQAVARDLGPRRALEARLRESRTMEAVGRLAGGVSHDFNNLLTVILGECECLLQAIGESPRAAESVRALRDAADRAASLTHQLMAFGRRQLLQPRRLDLNALVDGFAPLLRRMVGEQVQLEVETTAEVGQVEADQPQVEQILMNLALNARDAMPGGGRLTIRTETVEVGPAKASAFSVHPGLYAELLVGDTGMGMDEETRARLFEPFFTTKEAGKGTGLGLATTYGIVAQHGGFIEVDRRTDGGTVFRVHLPRAAESGAGPVPLPAAREAGPATPASAEPGRCTGTLLLVEDSDEVRRVALRILEREGYEVLAARDASVALMISDERGGAIDLLVTDLAMPGMSGRDLADILSLKRPALRVVYMSGHAGPSGLLDDTVLQSAPFIQKPFSSADLLDKVRQALQDPVGRRPA